VTSFDKVIPPGGVGKVTASLDTTHLSGAITKAISVYVGSPERIAAVLQVKAHVEPVVSVEPVAIPVLRTVGGETKAEFTVSSTEGHAFAVLTVQADPFLTAAVRPAGRRAGGRGRVAGKSSSWVVTVTPKASAPVGEAVRSVTLGTDLPGAETIPLRVVVFVVARARVVPARLTVKPAAKPPVLHVRIDEPGATGFRILGVESSDADFHATVSPVHEGREYDVVVRYAGGPAHRPVHARITARTNQPDAPTIVIPLGGRL
jgi:hypothetical protein